MIKFNCCKYCTTKRISCSENCKSYIAENKCLDEALRDMIPLEKFAEIRHHKWYTYRDLMAYARANIDDYAVFVGVGEKEQI